MKGCLFQNNVEEIMRIKYMQEGFKGVLMEVQDREVVLIPEELDMV